jgi:hypothetical protein
MFIIFRIIISFVLTVFLFVGIISTASVMFISGYQNDVTVIARVSEKVDTKKTIKEIEVETALSNYYFTAANSLR